MVLKLHQVEAVRVLLAQGMSYRDIKAATGVSRTSIGKIQQGKWADQRKSEARPLKLFDGPLHRCTCGALVYGECMACNLKEHMSQIPVPTAKSVDDED